MKSNVRKPTGGKRNTEQKDYDIRFCSNLFLRGYSYREIATALNNDVAERGFDYRITFQTVYKDLQKVLAEWKKESFTNIDEYVTQELKKLDKMEVELWEAWEKSKHSEKKKTRTSRAGGKDDDGTKRWGDYGYTENTNEQLAGNPRFFDLLLNVQQRRAKLLGYDAPIKIDIPGYTKPPEENDDKYNIKDIPDELLFAVVDKLQESKYQEKVI